MPTMPLDLTAPDDGADPFNAIINTTPLVDVMLVLLIIFLITIPVVTQSINLQLPNERNVPTQTRPDNVVISVDRDGDIFWGMQPVADVDALAERLQAIGMLQPQPEVHIRGDLDVRYEAIGRVVGAARRAGIAKVGFITEPQR